MSTFKCPVVKIQRFEPIKGKDRIQLAFFEGVDWQVIMAKGEHQIGDLVVYVPPDSVISQKTVEEYALDYLGSGNRVRAIRLGGVYSFGLTLPLPERFDLGDDASAYYGITKYEEPDPINKTVGGRKLRKKNPNFQKYTDIENARNYPDVFWDGDVVVTEKIHGTNFRCGWVKKSGSRHFWDKIWDNIRHMWGYELADYEFIIGTHNTQLDENSENEYTYIVKKYGLKEKLKPYSDMIFYGEIFGTYEGRKIQDMTYGFKHTAVAFFDILDTRDGNYCGWHRFKNILDVLGLHSVPVNWSGKYDEDIIKRIASDKSSIDGGLREGVVVRPVYEESDRQLGRKILKFINPEYLTRKEGTERH